MALLVLSLLYAVLALSMATEAKVVNKRDVCESGWTASGNRCFKFFNTALTWTQAVSYCVGQGAHLASIHNTEEAKLVGDLSGNSQWTWIGGGGSAKAFVWYWTDGSKFDYSNWHAWEPDNYDGNEHCISINFNGGGDWNDLRCDRIFPFVCSM